MKAIYLLLCLLVSICANTALASGKIEVKPTYDLEEKATKYSLGLSVYERMGDVALQTWIGGGCQPSDHGKDWLKVDNSAEMYMGPLAAGVGVAYTTDPDNKTEKTEIYTSMSLTLW